jgi:hypothetical protein
VDIAAACLSWDKDKWLLPMDPDAVVDEVYDVRLAPERHGAFRPVLVQPDRGSTKKPVPLPGRKQGGLFI